MSGRIPTDILMEILSRFPVKTLLRFTLVCKLWYSVITDPDFINIHLNRFSKRNADQLFLKLYTKIDETYHYALIPDIEKLDKKLRELAFPSEKPGSFYIISSCSGMICLRKSSNHVMIWNPSLRKSVTITIPNNVQETSWSMFGFGYVSQKSEYKLVRITYTFFDSNENECYAGPLRTEVYEQGKEHWKVIESVPPLHCEASWESQVPLHDSVHWLAHNKTRECDNWIMVFDMCDDVFRDIALPSNLAKQDTYHLSVTLFKNSLAVLETEKLEKEACWITKNLSLWEMRDYGVFESWTKTHNIVFPVNFVSPPLGFRNDGESLVLTDGDALVILYDSEAKTITSTVSIPRNSKMCRIENYSESLVLLKCK